MSDYTQEIAQQLALKPRSVANTIALLSEGGTVPFIARYRKEMTQSLDEVQIGRIRDAFDQHRELEKRKGAICESLSKRDLLSEQLERKVVASTTMTELEDIYLPYKPKRRTRAAIARQKGLEPLANAILKGGGIEELARSCVSEKYGVASSEDALAGARDIVAEHVSENETVRKLLRKIFDRDGMVTSRVVEKKRDEAEKFRDYFDWQEPVSGLAGHRLLALLRGEELKYLQLSFRPEPERAIPQVRSHFFGRRGHNEQLGLAIEDGYHRLLAPSLENELRRRLKIEADREAIAVFSKNLQELLLASPFGQKRVMALDPGYRTGAKLVCLDEMGELLHHETLYPLLGDRRAREAAESIRRLAVKYLVEAVCIGNGTGGRETEAFVRDLQLGENIHVGLVNEDGASIYSASESARREFSSHDLTVRGSVSIGRRFQDPLAELVKIDPKSIGVGQYQHDVNQSELQKGLEDVVSSCVNRVGVEVNSASVELLSHVAGLGPTLAENIVAYRREHGMLKSRQELLKVKRLGAKSFEQCSGFLRVGASANPLDNSGVHPERYLLVKKMAADLGVDVAALLHDRKSRDRIRLDNYVGGDIGMETLTDILAELAKPGRDPREKFTPFQFDQDVATMEDLKEGMVLPAIITNVTKFGAFADMGVKQDGLIHISQMADRFVKDPAEIVTVNQQVKVRVLEVDLRRKRIALSLRLTDK